MKSKLGFTKENIVASLGFAFFVVCPRMAGMMHVISKHSSISMLYTILLGIVVSIPLLMVMVYVFDKAGVWGTLSFCILTDFISALIMKSVSIRAGIETFVIAIFVVIGVKLTPYISSKIIFNEQEKKQEIAK
ncbi:hypothetical protein Y919_06650 [Caloranaerobacter azorensis H53214]|uniref:Uncharacterized protein n=1 Tax=Caloranaerobacter azorensis H53214 TaxID=1156417 RepID=A0A096BHY2_9FIRM|nr:hypothetical protein [Caloranaerobacter azorensis]KGG80388.1 hypothetical protein Y919_06650 [Caloranaerobacter azorensis H53214]